MQLTHLFSLQNVLWILGGSVPGQSPAIVESHYQSSVPHKPVPGQSFRPVVLWHGLGDNYNSSGIHRTAEIFDELYPGIYVHPVYLDVDPSKDEKQSIFGDANDELEAVCEELSKVPELRNGFDAIGFSQGGLFVRALVERCSSIQVHKFISFGSPHMGVSKLPLCKDPDDWICNRRNKILKNQVWLDKVQKKVIPAQYFRDPSDLGNYVLHSNFLVNINNEKPFAFNQDYRARFRKLEQLVLVAFTQDTILVPKESSQFVDYDASGNIVPFDKTTLYTRNLIGLKDLHESNKVDFLFIDDEHMRIGDEFLRTIGVSYIGTVV